MIERMKEIERMMERNRIKDLFLSHTLYLSLSSCLHGHRSLSLLSPYSTINHGHRCEARSLFPSPSIPQLTMSHHARGPFLYGYLQNHCTYARSLLLCCFIRASLLVYISFAGETFLTILISSMSSLVNL